MSALPSLLFFRLRKSHNHHQKLRHLLVSFNFKLPLIRSTIFILYLSFFSPTFGMLASNSGSLIRTKPPLPPRKPSCFRFGASDSACFDPGFLSRPSVAVRHKLSLNLIKMEVLRRMGGGCFKNHHDKGLKVEADSGGEDFYDVSTGVANQVSEHLVIMVNGIIGR